MSAIADIVRQDQTERLFFTFKSEGLPDAELKVREFIYTDTVFSLFQLEVALVSERGDLDLTAMMDKPGLVTVHDRYADTKRYFHGVVASAARGDSGRRHTMYRLTLKPALHRLRFTSDSKIFQQKTPREIIESVLQENGVNDYKFYLSDAGQSREFLVQYREQDLAFIERIMAEEGMHFFHEHREDGHRLIISDHSPSADKVANDEIEYNANAGGAVTGPYIDKFCWREEVRPTRVVLKDYSFKNPAAPMAEEHGIARPPGHASDYEIYDFPGRHKTEGVGQRFARFRLEGLRCETSLGAGDGFCAQLQAGMAFTLKEHDDKKLNREYFLVETNHHGTQPGALEEDAGIAHDDVGKESGTQLKTSFRVIPVATPWRPEQRTKPVVEGPQIAVVTGPQGEQIFTDTHGRVRLRFLWDRYAKNDDTSSCWIRVSQAWGGGTFGNVAIPRIGQEVIVGFLEGDPDQPLVLGRTYHATNISPYKLPDHKTKMAIRSDTHKGDGGFSEMSFEDERGKENFFMHAEKDQTLKVKNNQIARVDANASQAIGANQASEVGSNVSQQVGGGVNQVIGGVGAAAAKLVNEDLAKLMGQSGELLKKGMEMGIQAMQQIQQLTSGGGGSRQGAPAAGGSEQNAPAQAVKAVQTGLQLGAKIKEEAGKAQSQAAAASQDAASALHTAPTDLSAVQNETNAFAKLLSGGGLGALGELVEDIDKIRKSINDVARNTLRTTGGTEMATGGEGMGKSVGKMVKGGTYNQLVSKFMNQTTGIAKIEQIGNMKVSSVGHAQIESIGKARNVYVGIQDVLTVDHFAETTVGQKFTINVGDEFKISVGGKKGEMTSLTMKSDGTISIFAKNKISIVSEESEIDAYAKIVIHNTGGDAVSIHAGGEGGPGVVVTTEGNTIGAKADLIVLKGKDHVVVSAGHIGLNDDKM